jgi:tRNA uridine 5-carboxymethylaminomethyl modification enzyme
LSSNLKALERTWVKTSGSTRVLASQLLRQPEVRVEDLVRSHGLSLEFHHERPAIDVASLETTIKYAGYLRRQDQEIQRARRDERRRLPSGLPFHQVPGLSREVCQRLLQVQPDTLGQAARIPGVTPAAVAVLAAFISRPERVV